jgi:hypothetical protein
MMPYVTTKRRVWAAGDTRVRRMKHWLRDTFGDHRLRRAKALRMQAACKLNVGPWRRPGIDGVDVRLADAIGWSPGGTFIELGGNDGLQQSNSFLLERELGWRGVLIEGVPELAAEAVRNRPEATVICAAVTSAEKFGVVAMNDIDLESTISGTSGTVWVATTTLSTVIDLVLNGEVPDLLSVSVCGFELDVLAGLDLTRHRPRWIHVHPGPGDAEHDKKQRDAVSRALAGYTLVAQFSSKNTLYEDGQQAGADISASDGVSAHNHTTQQLVSPTSISGIASEPPR